MNSNFSYDRMDYYSILEYLKSQAKYYSDGRWTDFSDSDVGTVLLKLMAMSADTTNYQVEKGISELYIDTLVERSNALALCKIIGYTPRHFESAYIEANLLATSSTDYSNFTLPAWTSFKDESRSISYTSIEDINFVSMRGTGTLYEGTPIALNILKDDINEDGTYILRDYNVATNTIKIKQGGNEFRKIDNAAYGDSEACFSIHVNTDNKVYIQFPPYWSSIITAANIEIRYLLSQGASGRIGSGILTNTNYDGRVISFINQSASDGGYNPETIEEIQRTAPDFASTMDTLVTLNDFRILSKDFEGISDVVALDYNFEESGLIQPDDAYRVNVYILPEDDMDDTIFDVADNIKAPIQKFIDDVNDKRLASLEINYYDVDYIRPTIAIDVYMDPNDLRYSTVNEAVQDFIKNTYQRSNRSIGQAVYKYQISSDILNNIDYIKYLEITQLTGEVNGAIKPDKLTYIDITKNISITVKPYNA